MYKCRIVEKEKSEVAQHRASNKHENRIDDAPSVGFHKMFKFGIHYFHHLGHSLRALPSRISVISISEIH